MKKQQVKICKWTPDSTWTSGLAHCRCFMCWWYTALCVRRPKLCKPKKTRSGHYSRPVLPLLTSCPVSALPVVEVHDKVTNNKLRVCSDTRRSNTHYYSIFYSLIWMMSSQGLKPRRLLCERESQTEEKWRKASLVSDKGWALNHAELLCWSQKIKAWSWCLFSF